MSCTGKCKFGAEETIFAHVHSESIGADRPCVTSRVYAHCALACVHAYITHSYNNAAAAEFRPGFFGVQKRKNTSRCLEIAMCLTRT